MDPLVYAMPAFLAFSAMEAIVLRAKKSKSAYRLADFVSGMSCGVLDQVVNLAVMAGFLVAYDQVQASYGLVAFTPQSAWAWVAVVLAHDLAYYFFHRLSHRVNFLWAAHIVHHQSEDYNFSVSLRQGTVATWVTTIFYLPLALLGFPVFMFVVVHGVYQIYQFFVHTELCPRLGPLEWVLASPRNHRVHHGRNLPYLDKNYGGFFITWDRMFGTFAKETVEPTVGSRAGMSSWSPVWANYGHFVALARQARAKDRFGEKLRVWFGPPEGSYAKDELEDNPDVPRYDAKVPGRVAAYLGAQLVGTAIMTLYLLFAQESLFVERMAVLSVAIVFSLVTITAFFDRRRWALIAELVRLLSLVGAAVLSWSDTRVLIGVTAFALISLVALPLIRPFLSRN
jgi:sterol desaturase/sphingolipid hydroxylase (fatty acid hydroxylase superfamily)